MSERSSINRYEDASLPVDSEWFMKSLLRELTGVLQDIVGLENARGYIAIVGARIGDVFNDFYRRASNKSLLDEREIADAMVDLKSRIGGDFSIVSVDEDEIHLTNKRCPFGSSVTGRPSLCMMTSNVFGRLAAENLGYGRVALDETIAQGDGRCVVRISLNRNTASESPNAREYYRTEPKKS